MGLGTKQFGLDLSGFFPKWRETSLPGQSGVYFVFAGLSKGGGKCSIKRLLYIGESCDIQRRLTTHEKKDRFESSLSDGEILYYAYTLVPAEERDLCEDGLIKHFSRRFPSLINIASTNSFGTRYDRLQYSLKGAIPKFFNEEDISFCVYPEKG